MFRMRNRVKLDQILSNPKNPRKQLIVDELIESIKETGLLSPLLIRRIGLEKFEIISGHRRKEALLQMGEKYADCDIVEMTDEQSYKALMTANVQAHSLSEVEEAEGIKHMIDSYEWTQERVAKEFGKSQVWVNRRLDLLNLGADIQDQIITRVITATHGREIGQLPLERQQEVMSKVVEGKLSTRETADLVKKLTHPQIDDKLMEYVEPTPSTEPEIQSSETGNQIDTQLTNLPIEERLGDLINPEERRLYSDPDMLRISEMNGFILKLKDIEIDLQPFSSIMDSLVEFDRDPEALNQLDKIEFRINWIRKHITNARTKLQGGNGEGQVLAFKRKEA